MLTAELDYTLPADRIATAPVEPRDAAQLMVINRQTDRVTHHRFRDLPSLLTRTAMQTDALQANDLLVLNQTQVLPAYFTATRTTTHGRVTGLYLQSIRRSTGSYWQIILEARGRLRINERLDLGSESTLDLVEKLDNGQWIARLDSAHNTSALLHRIGLPPLPPYIRRQRKAHGQPPIQPADTDRYNTIFATTPGSVAAPTAGLHLTQDLLNRLEQIGVGLAWITLHVGLGTFAPVRTHQLEDHQIHSESVYIPAQTVAALRQTRSLGGRIIPVGTTSVRALESLPDPLPEQGDFATDTQLFIFPQSSGSDNGNGFRFRFTDALITNFHLPKSTLLALVAALPNVGIDRLLNWYQEAIEHNYRFYSYGDAMLIL